MKRLLVAAALLAGVFACTKIDQGLGGDLVPTNQQYDIYTAEFDLDEIYMKPADSLSAYSSRRINIGAIRDETYGLFKRGSVVTLVPVLDTVDFGKNPYFKKMRFQVALDSTSVEDVSQQHILQNVNVYALDKRVDSTQYFSRAEIPHGSKRITKGVPIANGSDSLKFEFTKEFGEQFMNITQEDLEDFDQYMEKFPGIYITTDEPAGNGGRFNTYNFNILYETSYGLARTDNYAMLYYNGEYEGERKDTVLMFYLSPIQFEDLDSLINVKTLPSQYVLNVDSHETDHLAGLAEDKIYVEGGSGLKPVIPASRIKTLVNESIRKNGGDPATALITKATIELPFEFPEDYTTMFRFPKMLSPTVKISHNAGVSFAGLTDASVSTENQGDVNRSLCNYAPDVTHHVQQLIRTDSDVDLSEYDIWLLIMWYEINTTTDSEASELSDYYSQLAYYEYYNQLYGGGYGGYGGYGYGGYGGYGSSYSNYYSYMMMAQYASQAASSTTSDAELDKDHYYRAILNGPKASGAKPKLKFTYAVPKE